MEAESLSLYL